MTSTTFVKLLSLCCVAFSVSSAKVIGGIVVDSIAQFPYQVVIFARFPTGSMISSGAIISQKFVITCAHCISGSESASIFYGSQQLSDLDFDKNQIVSSENYRIHPTFSTYINDIAVIKLDYSIKFSGRTTLSLEILNFDNFFFQQQLLKV
jgi:secreted trypsin-like serine protease